MTEKILVEHLVKKYGDNTVLNDINVSINEGDVVLRHRSFWFWKKYIFYVA